MILKQNKNQGHLLESFIICQKNNWKSIKIEHVILIKKDFMFNPKVSSTIKQLRKQQ